MLDVLNKIDEITHAGIARKQRSVTRLFPEFPARVRGVANKGGIRLQQMQPDYWHFKLHSGTEDNLWYDGYIRFKDLVEFLSSHVGDRRMWTKDKQHIDLRKLAKKVMFDCQIQVKCSCPAFLYYGPAYIMSLRKYDGIFGDRETRPPRRRNPRQYGAICKHMQAMLNAYPFYMSTLAGFLRDVHVRQIRYLENQAKRERGGFKKAAAELGRRKKAREEEPVEPVEEPTAEEPSVEEEPRESRVREAFEDYFKPIDKKEKDKRDKEYFEEHPDEVKKVKNELAKYPVGTIFNQLADYKSTFWKTMQDVIDEPEEADIIDLRPPEYEDLIVVGTRIDVGDDKPYGYLIVKWDGNGNEDLYSYVFPRHIEDGYRIKYLATKELSITEAMKDRLGECYALAGRYVMDNHNATLVHGTINGVRWTGKDLDNPHAWIEEGDEVYDCVWDKRFPVDAYYGMMQAKVHKRYDWESAAKAMLRAEHWGPWTTANESFEDQFKSLSDEEAKKRVPKGAVVTTVDIYYDEDFGGLVVEPPDDGFLYLKKGTLMLSIELEEYPDSTGMDVEYEGGGHSTSLDPDWYKPFHANEAFEDIFQPIEDKEFLKRMGWDWSTPKVQTDSSIVDKLKRKKYPILSLAYSDDIKRTTILDELPSRAKATKLVLERLESIGVVWVQFSQLKRIPPGSWHVNSGLQSVGVYGNDLMVIYENKVGVGRASAGNIAWVGKRTQVRNAGGSAGGSTYIKSLDALRGIVRKLQKLVSKNESTNESFAMERV